MYENNGEDSSPRAVEQHGLQIKPKAFLNEGDSRRVPPEVCTTQKNTTNHGAERYTHFAIK